MRLSLTLTTALLLLTSCASNKDPGTEERTSFKYRHSADEMWRQLVAEAREAWTIESADREKLEIVTKWDVELHAMNTFGRRNRITITLEGSDAEGYSVVALQNTEKNTDQENPLAASEADWEQMPSDGALAGSFLMKFHRRMNPPKSWQETDR